jgi:hypothetical protein
MNNDFGFEGSSRRLHGHIADSSSEALAARMQLILFPFYSIMM